MECNTCGFNVHFSEDVEKGELITCNDCGQEYEVISIFPMALKEIPILEEDYGQ